MSTREDIAAEREQLSDLTARFGPLDACRMLFGTGVQLAPPAVQAPPADPGDRGRYDRYAEVYHWPEDVPRRRRWWRR